MLVKVASFLRATVAGALLLAPVGLTARAAAPAAVVQLPAKVQADAADFTHTLAKLAKPEGQGSPSDVAWVKANVARMLKVDQYVRQFAATPQTKKYTAAERQAFSTWYTAASTSALKDNLAGLKAIVKENEWVDRKRFGDTADYDARVLVQYADFDAPFQKHVLETLRKLYPQGRTNPQNYAYLYDSLAAAAGKAQKFGTQGRCAAPGEWKPLPIEGGEGQVEARRAEVGLEPLSAFAARYASVCR